jgi:hypothetical protein
MNKDSGMCGQFYSASCSSFGEEEIEIPLLLTGSHLLLFANLVVCLYNLTVSLQLSHSPEDGRSVKIS